MAVMLRFHKANEVEIDFIFSIGSSSVAENGSGLVGGFEGRGIIEEVCTGARGERNRRAEETGEIRGGIFGLLASYVLLGKGSVYQ